jgi:hypothetical protein
MLPATRPTPQANPQVSCLRGILELYRLERACGGPLVNRRRPAGTTVLTPLARQLCQQAREHLGTRQ